MRGRGLPPPPPTYSDVDARRGEPAAIGALCCAANLPKGDDRAEAATAAETVVETDAIRVTPSLLPPARPPLLLLLLFFAGRALPSFPAAALAGCWGGSGPEEVEEGRGVASPDEEDAEEGFCGDPPDSAEAEGASGSGWKICSKLESRTLRKEVALRPKVEKPDTI